MKYVALCIAADSILPEESVSFRQTPRKHITGNATLFRQIEAYVLLPGSLFPPAVLDDLLRTALTVAETRELSLAYQTPLLVGVPFDISSDLKRPRLHPQPGMPNGMPTLGYHRVTLDHPTGTARPWKRCPG